MGVLGAVALLIAVVQVFGRYIDPANAITWAEEVIVYIAVWAVMIVASQLVRHDGHVRPDLVLRLLRPGAQRWVEMFNCLVAIAFTFGMVWYGWQVVDTAMLLDQRSSSDLQFPMWIYYAALPAGGLLMLVRYVIRLVRYAFLLRSADDVGGPLDPARGAARADLGAHRTDYRTARRVTRGMASIGFLVLFFGLLAAGMPIFLVLGACAAVLYFVSGQPIIGVAQNMIDQLNSTTLMALPLFVMAAAFMRRGGVAQALVDLSTAWLGGVKGSLGLVAVVSCALFAAICGSSVATALAMGTILLPAMIARGYPRGFSLGVLGASGTIGVVIPPSLALILYGIVTEQSVPRLFLAGILPGLLQAGAFFVWVLWYARDKNFPSEPAMPMRRAAARDVAGAAGDGGAGRGADRHLRRLHDGDRIRRRWPR